MASSCNEEDVQDSDLTNSGLVRIQANENGDVGVDSANLNVFGTEDDDIKNSLAMVVANIVDDVPPLAMDDGSATSNVLNNGPAPGTCSNATFGIIGDNLRVLSSSSFSLHGGYGGLVEKMRDLGGDVGGDGKVTIGNSHVLPIRMEGEYFENSNRVNDNINFPFAVPSNMESSDSRNMLPTKEEGVNLENLKGNMALIRDNNIPSVNPSNLVRGNGGNNGLSLYGNQHDSSIYNDFSKQFQNGKNHLHPLMPNPNMVSVDRGFISTNQSLMHGVNGGISNSNLVNGINSLSADVASSHRADVEIFPKPRADVARSTRADVASSSRAGVVILNKPKDGGANSSRDDVAILAKPRDDVARTQGADVARFHFADVTSSISHSLKGNASYANVLNGSTCDEGQVPSSSSVALHYIKPNVVDGRIKVSPPLEVAEEGSAVWRNTLVGYFVGKKLPFKVVDFIAHKIWDRYGLREVLSSDNGFFFFKFTNFQDTCVVLERAPWHMANRPLVLKHWQPSLPLAKEDVYKVPVWVRLYNVPFEYWTSKGLSFVASAVGCPLHADHITLSRKRLSYARVCVEIDARADLIEDFDFQCSNGMWISVKAEFEWLPMKCSSCGVFGHSLGTCPKLASKITENKPSKVWVPKPINPPACVDSSVDKEEEWVTVSRKNKGKKVLQDESLVPFEKLISDVPVQVNDDKGCSSHGMELVVYEPREEGECSPAIVTPNCVDLLAKSKNECTGEALRLKDVEPILDIGVGEEGVDDVSPISNVNSLALKAKDSLEKKKSGLSGKNKKASGGKKGRKNHSPRGGRWR